MEKYLLGIDIGTSGGKIAVFDCKGKVIGQCVREYPVYHLGNGYVEQDPKDWWSEIACGIKNLIKENNLDPQQIVGIGVDGQSWSAIPMDEEGNVLLNTPIWLDQRSSLICEKMNQKIGKEKIFQLCGNSLQPTYTTGKILWFRENRPHEYKKTKMILQSNSYIVYQLTGVYSQDKSQGYGLHCYDMRKHCWDETRAKELEIPLSLLPPIFDCHQIVGGVTKLASTLTGLVENTPVVAGGLDAACGTLGAGVIYDGQTQEQGGQAGGMSICMKEYRADERLILSAHVIPELYLLQGGTTGGGGAMRWFEQEFAQYEREKKKQTGVSSFAQLNQLAETVNPGSDGLIFLPYLAGERSPIWDASAKGVYYGIDFSKTKGHFVRALMEGVAFSLKHNLEVAREAGAKVTTMRSMGGSANSYLWTQIKADVTGVDIEVPSSDTATTLGAAILAGVGVGVFPDFDSAVNKMVKITRKHKANVEQKSVYKSNYLCYRKIYEHLKDTMQKGNEHESSSFM